MKNLIKPKEIIAYICVAILLLVFAIIGKWENILYLFSAPLTFVGNGVRNIASTSMFFAYAIYIVVGVLPLIFPIIRAIMTKKLYARDIMWVILSVFLFVFLYYFINPHKLQFFLLTTKSELREQFQAVALLGMTITIYAMLIFCLLAEFYFAHKKEDKRLYLYAKVLFIVLILGILTNIFFVYPLEMIQSIKALPQNTDIENSVNINKAINVWVILFSVWLKALPAIITMFLFIQAKAFVGDIQSNMFAKGNIPRLRSIATTCIITVFASLGAMIAQNLICFVFMQQLVNVYFNIAIPIGMILAACLILIFSKILIRSIELNEENKLVI